MQFLNDLKSVVEINSYTKNKAGVDAVGRIFDQWFEALGFNIEIFKRSDIGDHRYYTSTHDETGKKLLLLGHLDTVFPPKKFEIYKEDEEWVYGPGVCDMKGGNIVALEALREVSNAGVKIRNIDVLFVSKLRRE